MEHGTDELRDAPHLKKLAGYDPFVVPDGFFGRFPHTIAKRVAKPPSLRERLLAIPGIGFVIARPALVPAFLLVLGAMFYWALPTPNGSNPVSTEVLADFEPVELEDHELISILHTEPALGEGIGSGLATEDLEEYLEREDLTLEQLTELL